MLPSSPGRWRSAAPIENLVYFAIHAKTRIHHGETAANGSQPCGFIHVGVNNLLQDFMHAEGRAVCRVLCEAELHQFRQAFLAIGCSRFQEVPRNRRRCQNAAIVQSLQGLRAQLREGGFVGREHTARILHKTRVDEAADFLIERGPTFSIARHGDLPNADVGGALFERQCQAIAILGQRASLGFIGRRFDSPGTALAGGGLQKEIGGSLFREDVQVQRDNTFGPLGNSAGDDNVPIVKHGEFLFDGRRGFLGIDVIQDEEIIRVSAKPLDHGREFVVDNGVLRHTEIEYQRPRKVGQVGIERLRRIGTDEQECSIFSGMGQTEFDGKTGFADAPLTVDHILGDEGRGFRRTPERIPQFLHFLDAAHEERADGREFRGPRRGQRFNFGNDPPADEGRNRRFFEMVLIANAFGAIEIRLAEDFQMLRLR